MGAWMNKPRIQMAEDGEGVDEQSEEVTIRLDKIRLDMVAQD